MDVRNDWTRAEVSALFDLPFMDLVFRAHQIHRVFQTPNTVQISTLLSIKTGACPEDCAYCPQSVRFETGLEVSQLCLGTMSMGSSAWKSWVLDEPESTPILRRALDLGINFFDMADWYSTGRNEEVHGTNPWDLSGFGDRAVLGIHTVGPGPLGHWRDIAIEADLD